MTLNAYAKVNLFLDIISRRPDGYHDLRSVMHIAPVYDVITLDTAPAGMIEVTCSDSSLNGEDNICYKAANRFFEKSGIVGGAGIHIEKHIPHGAGLGGGSADAAAVLNGLNGLYGNPLEYAALHEIAAFTGADVPFCLSGHKCALCEGIGDKITPVVSELDINSIGIHFNKFAGGISTSEVYKAYDSMVADIYHSPLSSEVLAGFTLTAKNLPDILFNVFEQVIFPMRPDVALIKSGLINKTRYALMSGSGPAVFSVSVK